MITMRNNFSFQPARRARRPLRSGYGLIAASAVSLLLAACAAGPDYKAPAAPASSSYTPETLAPIPALKDTLGGTAQDFVTGMDIPGQWWTLLGSPQLNAVITKALRANPDLAAAKAALRAAEESVYAQQGAYYPSVGVSFDPTRQRVVNSTPALYTLHTAQLNVAYTADVFGSNQRQVENLQALAAVQKYQVQAAYLTLTSNVVAAAIQEASLRAQIDATHEIIRVEQELLNLLQRQYALGDAAQADVLAEETTLAQTYASLPPLQNTLSQQRDLLVALTGGLPDQVLPETFTLDGLKLPVQMPVSLPSKLVAQRPDIAAAEAQLHAASAAVGIAAANMLPQITLSASVGSSAATLGSLFTSGNGVWSVVGGLTQPIFAGGTLLHRKRSAEAQYDEAAAQYRSTVVKAFQNVADSLRALQYDADLLRTQAVAEHSAANSLAIAKRSVALGAATPQTLLSAIQAYQQTLIGLVQAQANRYSDSAALFLAMGGGWWNRDEQAEKNVDLK